MRLLVTGGAGFIGSEFVRMTLRDHPEDTVIVLDALTYAGHLTNLATVWADPRLRFVHGTVVDLELVTVLADESDVVVNFAAETHVDRSLEGAGHFILTDVYGTWALVEAARRAGHDRFLQVSTDEVYGHVPDGRSLEDDPLRPRSPYSASKAGGELQLWAYRDSHGSPVVVTRGSNTYGQHQFPEKIIPLFILNALEGRPVPIYGDGTAVRDYIHVSDHATGIDVVLRRGTPGRAYNIGAGQEISGNTVADAVLAATGAPADLREHVADRPGHDRRYAIDTSALRALGWSPRVPFDEGIAATVLWYRNHEEWWRPLRSADYWAFYQRTYRGR